MSEEREIDGVVRCDVCWQPKGKCNCEISDLDLAILEEEELERKILKRDNALKPRKKLKRTDRRLYE